ncbi:6381_t:CDS:2 [Ambispora leptoticha]|uniref:U3 small nucleolar RNA-associated protein 11 n=1 Tax=Ambispora leptoticha TaxID=144679 RepID=A0A9N8WJ71_9GLOM|nr:6381_t:CDS:2 [Ambispora leptoticha]
MSSLRNAVQRRNHKERAQPYKRERYGILEKHKDYVLRARDYHAKQERLKKLREKAYFRNPDEFYFKMINSKTKGGVHVSERNNAFSGDVIKLLKSQDLNYIKTQRDIGRKKIEKLQNQLHFLASNDDEVVDEENEGTKKKDSNKQETLQKNANRIESNHIIFFDTEEEVKNFDPAKHFNTLPELVNRKFNRPRIETLEKQALVLPEDIKQLRKMQKERINKYQELADRLEREDKFVTLEQELVTQKNLMGKGRRKKVGIDKNGLAVYKWKNERKK